MIEFILNDRKISTAAAPGMAMLDFIRNDCHLKGNKLVCKEGECGACSVLVGSLAQNNTVEYQSMTSCIMPLINANGKHIVSIEGLNMAQLSPVQQAMVDAYGTQCGFCTPGFVVSLTGFLLSSKELTLEAVIQFIDGNICRCTGYKSIERAAESILNKLKEELVNSTIIELVKHKYLPTYFLNIVDKLNQITTSNKVKGNGKKLGGGTDLYVQQPHTMYAEDIDAVYDNANLKKIEIENEVCTFGAALTMGDLYRSDRFKSALPNSDYIFKLLSSTQIRNMATIGGNLVNASPIGDFTILLLALNSTVILNKDGNKRTVLLQSFYKGYKKIDLMDGELLEAIQFKIPDANSYFHFEKVSQRKYFDIASVNFASTINVKANTVQFAHLAVGGVGPIPVYLHKTAAHLKNKPLNKNLIEDAFGILQDEITPISDARGSAAYKRLLARQLLLAQFMNIDTGFGKSVLNIK